jgi:hypothetical protein
MNHLVVIQRYQDDTAERLSDSEFLNLPAGSFAPLLHLVKRFLRRFCKYQRVPERGMGKCDLAPSAADERNGNGPAHNVEHHQEQLNGHSHDRALGPRLQLATQGRKLAPSSVVFCVPAEAF